MTVPEEPTESSNERPTPQDADGPSGLVHAALQYLHARPSWVTVAAAVGGAAVTAAATTAATLALTHNTAVRGNAFAYVNGRQDGYAQGFFNGLAAMLDHDQDLE